MGLLVEFAALGFKFFGFFGELFFCVVTYVLCDFHGAEFGAAHGTEMGDFGALGGEGFVVVGSGSFWIKT